MRCRVPRVRLLASHAPLRLHGEPRRPRAPAQAHSTAGDSSPDGDDVLPLAARRSSRASAPGMALWREQLVRVHVEDGGEGDRLLPHPDESRRGARNPGRVVARPAIPPREERLAAGCFGLAARKRRPGAGVFCFPSSSGAQWAPSCARIDFSALPSIWRMRSAETPYSSARSCNVAGSFSTSQRAWMMRRLRSSSLASARFRPAAWLLRSRRAREAARARSRCR